MTQTNPKAYVSVTVTEGGSSSVWHSPSAWTPFTPLHCCSPCNHTAHLCMFSFHSISPFPWSVLVQIRASSYHLALPSAFAPWCGSWRLRRQRCWQHVRALCLSQMFACTRTVYRSSFPFSLEGARSEWVATEQRLRETQPECCHFNSDSSLLAGKPIDFPYYNAAKRKDQNSARRQQKDTGQQGAQIF